MEHHYYIVSKVWDHRGQVYRDTIYCVTYVFNFRLNHSKSIILNGLCVVFTYNLFPSFVIFGFKTKYPNDMEVFKKYIYNA